MCVGVYRPPTDGDSDVCDRDDEIVMMVIVIVVIVVIVMMVIVMFVVMMVIVMMVIVLMIDGDGDDSDCDAGNHRHQLRVCKHPYKISGLEHT